MPLEVSCVVYVTALSTRAHPALEFGFSIVVMQPISSVIFRRMVHQAKAPLLGVLYVHINRRSRRPKVKQQIKGW